MTTRVTGTTIANWCEASFCLWNSPLHLVMREHLKAARHHLRLVLDDIDRDRTSRSEPPAAARARRA